MISKPSAACLIACGILLACVTGGTRAQSVPFAMADCPTLQHPVCARKVGRNETYPNACLASRDKARVIAQERCPEFCSRIYAPVCGLTDRRRLQTYGNSCEAVLAGARVIRQRPCWLQR